MFLLDTCAFIYYIMGSDKLTSKVINIIESDDKLFLSQSSPILTYDHMIDKYDVSVMW